MEVVAAPADRLSLPRIAVAYGDVLARSAVVVVAAAALGRAIPRVAVADNEVVARRATHAVGSAARGVPLLHRRVVADHDIIPAPRPEVLVVLGAARVARCVVVADHEVPAAGAGEIVGAGPTGLV